MSRPSAPSSLLTARLRADFPEYTPTIVEAAVTAAAERMRTARLDTFVHVFVERYAREALRQRRRADRQGVPRRPMVVYVVRHALAGDKVTWAGDDGERPLDETGRADAERLAQRFDGLDLRALVASPARRCIDTLAPLAARRRLPVAVDDRLALRAEPSLLDGGVFSGAFDRVVLCTHGEVMRPLLARLHAEGVPIVADTLDDDELLAKGGVWAIEHDGGAPRRLTHAAPDRGWARAATAA